MRDMFHLAQFCEDVLNNEPVPGRIPNVKDRAHEKMILLIERVKEHLYRADNQMYGEHARRGREASPPSLLSSFMMND